MTQRDLSSFQQFALSYHLNLARRIARQDVEDMLQRQAFYLAPERYNDLFFAEDPALHPLTIAGRPVEEVVDDVDEVDAYFQRLEGRCSMPGDRLVGAASDGWI